MPKTNATIMSYAEVYANLRALGFKLIPLKARSKEPAEDKWQKRDHSDFDAEKWRQRGGNVGIIVGDDHVAIDIDPRHGGDTGALEMDFDALPHRTLAVRTGGVGGPGGLGMHLYYRKPRGQRVAAKVSDRPGVEVRTGNMYCLAPGSVHPETGKVYALAGPVPSEVPPLPRALFAKIKRRAPEPRRDEADITPERLAELLAALDPRDFGKDHHDQFVSLMAACHEVTNGDGREVFLEWAAGDPDYGADATETTGYRWDTFESGKPGGAGMGTIRKALVDAGRADIVATMDTPSAADDFEDDEEDGGDEGGGKRAKESRFKRLTPGELFALEPPRWLLEPLIPEDGLIQLYGARKKGKTFVALDIALCIATGRAYHGHKTMRGRVTYVIGEGGKAQFADRVRAWCKHNRVDPATLEGWLKVVPVRVGVDNKADLKEFLAEDDEANALVIFDTLARSMDGDENSTHDMNIAVKGLDKVRDHVHGAVMVVHHSGKDEGRQGRGSTALPGAVDATLKVYRNKANRVVLKLEEARNVESGIALVFEPVSVVIDGDINRSALVLDLATNGNAMEPETAADRILVHIVRKGHVSDRGQLVDSENGLSQPTVYRTFKALIAAGLIDGEGAGPFSATAAGRTRAALFSVFSDDEEDDEQDEDDEG